MQLFRGGIGRVTRLSVVAIVLVTTLLASGLAWYDFVRLQHRATREVNTRARLLATTLSSAIVANKIGLDQLIDHAKGRSSDDIRMDAAFHAMMNEIVARLPLASSIFLVDPSGLLVATTLAFPVPSLNLSQREYYQAAVHGDAGWVVSPPFVAHLSHSTNFTLSRTVNGRSLDDGVVALGYSPIGFQQLFETATAGGASRGTALMLHADGRLLLEYPMLRGSESGAQDQRLILPAGEEGMLSGNLFPGRPTQIAAFRRLSGVPLSVVFSSDLGAYREIWYRHVGTIAIAAALACLSLCAVLGLAMRQLVRAQTRIAAQAHAAILRDRAEQTLQHGEELAAIEDMATQVSSDLNNLLTALLGTIDLARQSVGDATSRRLADAATAASARCAGLTRHMMALSRGPAEPADPVAVNTVIRGVEAALAAAGGPGMRLVLDLAPSLWPAWANAAQLEVALASLASHASALMAPGGALHIETTNQPSSGSQSLTEDCVVIAVTIASVADHDAAFAPLRSLARRHALNPLSVRISPEEGTTTARLCLRRATGTGLG